MQSEAQHEREVAAWICLGHNEDLADAVRRKARFHGTRREAREERLAWPAAARPHVVPLMVRKRQEPSHRRRFRRVRGGVWTWIRCSSCGYEGEMVDVHRCTLCDDVLCSRKCCADHACRRRLPHHEKGAAGASLLAQIRKAPQSAQPSVASQGERRFARYAEGTWMRIRCVACGYVGEMIDVYRCGLCDGILCGRVCRDAHDCRVQHTGT